MAEDKKLADDKKKLAADNEHRDKARAEHLKRSRGTPTPTQEEADLIKLGNHVELAKDGSAEDPNVGFTTKQLEGSSKGGYETRETAPKNKTTPPTQHS